MRTLRVAGAQLAVRDVQENEQAIICAIERAGQVGADILLTPEGSLSGYRHDFDRAAVAAALDRVIACARDVGVGLALGTCFTEDDGLCYNQLRFYGRDGSYLGFHAKILLCDQQAFLGRPQPEGRGEVTWYASRGLRTFEFGQITVAGLVCNDLWATPGYTLADPHLVRQAAVSGAKIIFHAVNGGRAAGHRSDRFRAYHEANLRLRAEAANIPIATVDSAAPLTTRCSSPGGVMGTDGEWLVRTPWRGEHFFVTDVPLPA
jgi:predicted amidohydrolase